MATYLKHIPSGDIYPNHPLLASDKDYTPCDFLGNVPGPPVPPEPEYVTRPKVVEADLETLLGDIKLD